MNVAIDRSATTVKIVGKLSTTPNTRFTLSANVLRAGSTGVISTDDTAIADANLHWFEMSGIELSRNEANQFTVMKLCND